MAEQASTTRPGGPQVLQQALEEGGIALRDLQQILANMGRDDRRKSPEFQHLMTRYKTLGVKLQAARKLIPPVVPMKRAAQAGSETSRPVSALGARSRMAQPTALAGHDASRQVTGPRPASGSDQATAPIAARPLSEPVLGAQASQAYGRNSVAGSARSPHAGEKSGSADAAPRAQLPAAVPLEAVPAMGLNLAAQAYGGQAAPAPGQPQIEPLNLPKFKSSLGLPGPRSVHRGEEVVNLQTVLAHLGYEVKPSGCFDVVTLRAVHMFQKANKLPLAQVVGTEMRKLLNTMVTGESPG